MLLEKIKQHCLVCILALRLQTFPEYYVFNPKKGIEWTSRFEPDIRVPSKTT